MQSKFQTYAGDQDGGKGQGPLVRKELIDLVKMPLVTSRYLPTLCPLGSALSGIGTIVGSDD